MAYSPDSLIICRFLHSNMSKLLTIAVLGIALALAGTTVIGVSGLAFAATATNTNNGGNAAAFSNTNNGGNANGGQWW